MIQMKDWDAEWRLISLTTETFVQTKYYLEYKQNIGNINENMKFRLQRIMNAMKIMELLISASKS